MNTQLVFVKGSVYLWTFLFALPLSQCSYARQGNAGASPSARVDATKRMYDFEKWGGKVKIPNRRIERLNIDPNLFTAVSAKTTIFAAEPNRVSLKMADKDSGLDVSIDIGVTDSPQTAHMRIITSLSYVTRPGRVDRRVDPNDPNDPLNIGDVCFVPADPWIPEKSKKPVLRSLMFCRDNTFVRLQNSDDETREVYPDLGRIALLIDRKLKEISRPK